MKEIVMTKKEPLSAIKENFLKEMDKILTGDGFKRKAQYQDYDRKIGEKMTHNIHFTFVYHRGLDYDVSVHAAVAHWAVQKLLFGWRDDMTSRKIKETATYGYELGQLKGMGYLEWTIDCGTKLTAVASEIYTFIKLIGYPFLERYSDLRVILEELYSPDPREWKTDRDNRAQLIPIIEAVLGEKEKSVKSFRKFYEELRKEDEEFYSENYLPLIRYVCKEMNMKSPF